MKKYPFIHVPSEESEGDDCGIRMEVIYGPPEVFGIYDRENNSWGNKISFCIFCGSEVTDQMDFCDSCGKDIRMTRDPEITLSWCDSCGNGIPAYSKFCPYCGSRTRI